MKGEKIMPKQILVADAKQFLEKLKFETAEELGIKDYANLDKGQLPARINGAIGGHMVRKMIKAYQEQLMI